MDPERGPERQMKRELESRIMSNRLKIVALQDEKPEDRAQSTKEFDALAQSKSAAYPEIKRYARKLDPPGAECNAGR